MVHHKKAKLTRILIGIFILTVLLILIIPKPETKEQTTGPSPSSSKNTWASHTVTLTAKGFEPDKITINKGDVVTWLNKSGGDATVNSADHPTHRLFPVLNLGNFADGSSVQAKINRTGVLKYHNHLNPTQTGTIVVLE